ncbi:MAG TPA: hypothetical protein VJB14_16720 [Planctomycetota bacterium]|nr:hypothetical protein [Planctomycetota bacterium]
MATPTTITGENSLQRLTAAADRLDGVRKRDLSQGDWVLVTTKNSVYVICALGNDLYQVSGGYFDRKGLSPATTTINGCTWGGSAIKVDIVAGPGLFLEFGNRVLTTRIRSFRLIPAENSGTIH